MLCAVYIIIVVDDPISKITNRITGSGLALLSFPVPGRHRSTGGKGSVMGRRPVCDPEVVLDAFARDLPLTEISRSLGGIPIGTLGSIIHRARKEGDPRAGLRRRVNRRVAPAQDRPSSPRVRRLMLARQFPGSTAELSEAVARADIPVQRLRPGIATSGWRPSWLRT